MFLYIYKNVELQADTRLPHFVLRNILVYCIFNIDSLYISIIITVNK